MHLNHATFRAVPSRPAGCAIIASGCALLPTSYAYGLTVDELVGFASAQPVVTFGVGCAIGAVVGGLVAALVGRGRRRSLERRIIDLETMVQQQGSTGILGESQMESTVDLAQNKNTAAQGGQEAMAAPVQQEQQEPQAQPMGEQAQGQQDQIQAQDQQDQAQQVQTPDQAAQDAPKQAQPATAAEPQKGEHSVSKVLLSRLSSGAFDDVPVITRGAQREPDLESTAKRVAMRHMDPVERAKTIDKRIPRFDESMFPESLVVEDPNADEFEQAMNAMENSIEQEMEARQSEPDFKFIQPEGHPEINDAAAYVDYLLNDEMESSCSYRARRFSPRPKLIVFEGTGDLSKARQRTHVARHLVSVSKEA